LPVVVQADADNLKTLVVIFLIRGNHIGNFRAAWHAPSRPKVNQHYLASQTRCRKWLAHHVLLIENRKFCPDRQIVLNSRCLPLPFYQGKILLWIKLRTFSYEPPSE